MSMSSAPRRGRPFLGDAAKRASFNTRLRGDLKARLDAAAKDAGRSLSEEIEHRLETSITAEQHLDQALELWLGPTLCGLVLIVAKAMRDTGMYVGFASTGTLEGSANWPRDPAAYDEAVKAAIAVLEHYRPEGEIVPVDPRAGDGAGFAAGVIAMVAGRFATGEIKEWAARRRAQLGELADLPEPPK